MQFSAAKTGVAATAVWSYAAREELDMVGMTGQPYAGHACL